MSPRNPVNMDFEAIFYTIYSFTGQQYFQIKSSIAQAKMLYFFFFIPSPLGSPSRAIHSPLVAVSVSIDGWAGKFPARKKILHHGRFTLLQHDGLIPRDECLHDAPSDEISHGTDAEHHHVSSRFPLETEELEGRSLSFSPSEERSGPFVDHKRTDTSGHGPNARDRADGGLGEHIANRRVKIGRPSLMPGSQQSDNHGRPPGAVSPQWLCKHAEQGEACKNQQGQHPSLIGIHAAFIHEIRGQITASNRNHRHNRVKRQYEQDTHC